MRLQLTLKKGEEKVFGKRISTDKDGYFAFKSLPPADRYIVVPNQSLPGLAPKERSGSLLATNVIKDVDFTVDRKVSFAPPEEAENQAALGTISGRVIADDTGEGIEWIWVNVVMEIGEERKGFTTYTNEEGYYEFKGLPPGSYGIRFSPGMESEFITTDNTNVYDTQPPLPIYTADLPEGGNITFPDFTLVRGGGVSGVVVDKYGNPIKQALIDTNCGFGGITDEKGAFTALGMPEGNDCKLVIRIRGYAELPLVKEYIVKKGEINNLGVLQPPWDLSTGIEGVVRSSITNKPIKGAYAYLYTRSFKGEYEKGYEGYIQGGARTDSEGHYKIVGFPEGDYDFQSYLPISDPEGKYNIEEGIAFKKGTILKRDIFFDIESFEPAVDPEAKDKLNSCGPGRMIDIQNALMKASDVWKPQPPGCLPQSEINRFDPNSEPYIYFYCSTTLKDCGGPLFKERTVYLDPNYSFNVGTCGCLEGTIFHELLHFTDQGRNNDPQIVTTQDEIDAYNCTMKCIN